MNHVCNILTDQLFKSIDINEEKYIDFLCKICSYEARAYDKETIDNMVSYIAEYANCEGFEITRTNMKKCGDFLTVDINRGKEKSTFFMAHMDTVHEKGSFGAPVVRIEDDRIYGPGVIDCKGGIAIALLTMKALLDNGFNKHVRLILTSDEEISNILGGNDEIKFIQNSANGFPCAINCETAEKDEVVIARKGILKYKLDVKGVSGHSGKHYFSSKNAILEAAHKIIALHEKSVPNGTTYSCNVIKGGSVLNVIPDNCSISVDIRALTAEDMEFANKTVQEIANTSFISGTECDVTCLSKRPPMEKKQETMDILNKLLQVCHENGLGTLSAKESGGGSDSSYTQAAGIPTICGMGASGAFQHTPKEFLTKSSIALRAKILAAFCISK